MKSTSKANNLISFLIALAVFIGISLMYFSPILSGKVLSMHDVNMAVAAAHELVEFHEKTGEWAWWTNSMFGGMPGFMITGDYPMSFTSKLGSFVYGALPTPINIYLLLMLCFYLFARVIKLDNLNSILTSIAFAFGTYNLVFVEAGHVSKILALAFLPGLMAGFVLIFRKEYLLGSVLTSFFLGMELYANHIQMTYYFFFVLLIYSIYHTTKILKAKEYKVFGKVILSFAIALIIGVGMHTQRLWSNIVYSAETTRGVSELTQSSSGNKGLDRDYAFSWSYGISESINLMVPNFMGGASIGTLDENSEVYSLLQRAGVDAQSAKLFISSLPLYHGNQSSTAGPAYSGVLIIFLFILGLFLIKDKWRYGLLGSFLLLLVLSWGSNFSTFNYLIYDLVPGYNKFRAVSAILIIAHFILVWGAGLVLNYIILQKPTFKELKAPFLYTLIIMAVIFIIGYFSINFVGIRDEAFLENLKPSLGENLANQLMNALRNDRATILFSDVYRGLFLLTLTLATIILYASKKIGNSVLSVIVGLLILFDLFGVGKRYFDNNDFESKVQAKNTFEPTTADLTILEDKSINYRVLNLTTSFMSDARDSYFHKSIGGYHGAKLKKYNELVETQMFNDGRLNLGVINMLNTKYFINQTESGLIAQLNPNALGNAWLIDTLLSVENADKELELTGKINTKTKAVTQSVYVEGNQYYNIDEMSRIELTSYTPNKLVYTFEGNKKAFIVFSEIFYRGNEDWISYLDGKVTNHIKVNYVLRGMEVPAGKHEIVFEFKPKTVQIGKKFDLAASLGFFVLLGILLISNNKKKKALDK